MAGKRPKGNPEKLSKLLAGGLTPELSARLKDLVIWQSWEQAVGKSIAGRAQPLRLVGGVLTIVVASGPWMQQLSFMKAELRERINGLLGDERVREIVLKAGRLHRDTGIVEPERPSAKPLSPYQHDQIARQVNDLEDSELRQSLQALMEQHFRNR